MGFPWFRMSEGQTTEAILAGQRFAAKEAAIDALIAAGPGGCVNYIHQAKGTLEHNDIIALPSGAISLVSAPGEDKVILPSYGLLIPDVTGGAYNNISTYNHGAEVGFLGIFWGDFVRYALAEARTSLVLGSGRSARCGPKWYEEFSFDSGAFLADTSPLSEIANAPLMLVGSNSGNFGAGHADNTLRWFIEYRLLDLTSMQLVAA